MELRLMLAANVTGGQVARPGALGIASLAPAPRSLTKVIKSDILGFTQRKAVSLNKTPFGVDSPLGHGLFSPYKWDCFDNSQV
jgi:hypothetical protein